MSIGILSIRYGILDFKDVSGIVHCVLANEYLSLMSPVPLICCRLKIGMVTGALTWKAVAATAGVASIIGGVDQLLEEIMSVKSTRYEYGVFCSREEIHKAYYVRVKELGL